MYKIKEKEWGNLNDDYLSLAEAAGFLKISMSKMQKMSANRVLPIYKPSNGKVYFLKDDLIAYLKEGRKASKEEIEKLACECVTEKEGGKYG